MKLKPGSLIVFEGLDATGKSTQIEAVQERLDDVRTMHMPSGDSELAQSIYKLTEEVDDMRPLTRQLLHLAAHSESAEGIHEALNHSGLILDRWWWSTMAYGYYGAELDTQFASQRFINMLSMVWGSIRADLVFLFTHQYAEDRHNNSRVQSGYEILASQGGQPVITVPYDEPDAVTDFIITNIQGKGLAA